MRSGMMLIIGAAGLPGLLLHWAVGRHPAGGPAIQAERLDSVTAHRVDRGRNGIEWFWAINGPVSADGGGDLAVDDSGNVFLAGSHGGLDLDHDGVVDLPSAATVYRGARNPLIMKLGPAGPGEAKKIRWARSPHTPADRAQSKVATDGRGGAYLVGAFMDSLSFDGGPRLEGAGGNDAFIARYDGDGKVTWARVFGGAGASDAIFGLASDRKGNAYVVGAASGAFRLDDRGAEFRTSAQRAAALVSYGPEGSVRWHRIFGPGTPLAFVVRVAPSGQVYVSGELEGAADFDQDGRVDLPAPRDRDGFVARFAPDGAFLGAWATPMPGGLAFGTDGDVFLGGEIGGATERRYGAPDFDRDTKPDVERKGRGSGGTWIARYSPDGSLRWVRSYALERAGDLEVRDGLVALAGSYTGVRDLDEDGQPEPRLDVVDSSRESDLAILILSAADGRPIRVWTAPGPGNDGANAVSFLPNERSLLVTGAIQLTADFSGDGEDGEGWIKCENLGDVFVAQYRLPEPPPVERREPAGRSRSRCRSPRWKVGARRGSPGPAPSASGSRCTATASWSARWPTTASTSTRFLATSERRFAIRYVRSGAPGAPRRAERTADGPVGGIEAGFALRGQGNDARRLPRPVPPPGHTGGSDAHLSRPDDCRPSSPRP